MDNITKSSTHPMMIVAAVAVTVASLAAAAHFTGLLPTRGNETPPAVSASAPTVGQPAAAQLAQNETPAPAASEADRPAAKPHRHPSESVHPARRANPDSARQAGRADEDQRNGSGTHRVSANNAGIDVISSQGPAGEYPPPAASRQICRECGTVESVREVDTKGEGTGLGAVAGGVLGGVLGHQVGGGKGKDLATIAGAVGGAFAGHQVEKNVRSEKQYQVAVRFDDGSVRSYTLTNPAWRSGDRVRLANGSLVALNSGSPER